MPKELYNNFVRDFNDVMCRLADGNQYSNILFVCIGTDRVTGDCFGPLVGYKLNSLFSNANRINIIGDLENPVNATNIVSVANQIRQNYQNPFIISIDSALSTPQNIGNIVVREGGLDVGTGLNKRCINIGNMCIQGVVAQNTRNSMQNLNMLQNTSLNLVMNLADVVSSGIYNVINYDV